MNVRATIMDLQPGAALPRFATVEALIETLQPIEPMAPVRVAGTARIAFEAHNIGDFVAITSP